VADLADVPARQLEIRRHAGCVCCGAVLAAGTTAWWDPERRSVTCTTCRDSLDRSPMPALAALQLGDPGASLVREYERRKRDREQRTREAHPRIGGLLLALRSPPQHESAFHRGAAAERAVADSMAMRTDPERVITLHNRRTPSGRGDIDHLAVAPTGVWVIDTKDWKGKVEISSPWFKESRLLIRGRDCTKLIDGLERQIAAVRAALDDSVYDQVTIQGALCFTKADLPFLRTQTFRGHLLLYRRALAKRLNADGPLSSASIEQLARRLATLLPPAR
jgi:Nuclease-related domain